jgi:hypothetical protein
MLLFVIGVRPLTWPMISMSTSRPVQAVAVPKKRMVEPFMNSRHCARLSIVPGMATATYSKILMVRRKPSLTVVYAWTWWSMSPSTARVPNKTLIACRVVREELPRKVRSLVGGTPTYVTCPWPTPTAANARTKAKSPRLSLRVVISLTREGDSAAKGAFEQLAVRSQPKACSRRGRGALPGRSDAPVEISRITAVIITDREKFTRPGRLESFENFARKQRQKQCAH